MNTEDKAQYTTFQFFAELQMLTGDVLLYLLQEDRCCVPACQEKAIHVGSIPDLSGYKLACVCDKHRRGNLPMADIYYRTFTAEQAQALIEAGYEEAANRHAAAVIKKAKQP